MMPDLGKRMFKPGLRLAQHHQVPGRFCICLRVKGGPRLSFINQKKTPLVLTPPKRINRRNAKYSNLDQIGDKNFWFFHGSQEEEGI